MAEYFNKAHYGDQGFEWDPANRVWSGGIQETSAGYLPTLIGMLDQVRAGTAKPYDVEWVGKMIEDARAIPTRDIASLTAGWQGEHEGQWTDNGWQEGSKDWWSRLDPLSPDVGPIALQIKDKLDRGTATDQEKALFEGVMSMGADWDYRASTPQASDAFNPLGDQLFGALGTIALGATGGLAAAPLFAGGAGLATTLGSAGTLAGIAGTGASTLGAATDQPWLKRAGQVLGAVGGLAGGASGLANLWGTGIHSLSDAARLASSAGKVTGALGSATGVPGLQQAGSYLGLAGNLGQAGSDLSAGNLGAGVPRLLSVLGQGRGIAQRLAGGQEGAPQGAPPRLQGQRPDLVRGPAPTSQPLPAPLPAPMMPPGRSGPQPDSIGRLLAAAQFAQHGGQLPDWRSILMRGALMEGWGYDDNWGAGSYDDWSGSGGNVGVSSSPDFYSSPAYQAFTGWGDPTGPGSSGDTSGGSWWGNLGGILGGVGSFLGQNAGTLGPLASTLGGVVSGAIGSNAAGEASAQQAAALNRGIDLSTAQWLQQQANLAPYLQAGQQGLSQLQSIMGREQPALPGGTPAVQGSQYGLPSPYPGWQPRQFQRPDDVNAGAYQWTPQQGPQAANYRYTPGQTPDAAQYASGPPQLYQGAMPGTQVSTLTGQQVLDQDPGAAFRQSEARKALEGSAAARGDLLSGGTLQALQARSQDLASQEYGNAWQRMMARDTEQYGRNWGQYQQAWNQGVQGTQLGLQTTAQNFGQAMSAAQLREQVNQVASQQGWSQAQAEAAFREQMAQQSQAQNFGQAMAGQQNAYTQGLGAEQWAQKQHEAYATQLYDRQAQQAQQAYGRDVYSNEQDYTRQQNLYRQQLAQHLLPWEQGSTLANLGGQGTSMYGTQGAQASRGISDLLAQLGSAQGTGRWGQAYPWQSAIQGGVKQLPDLLSSLNS